MDLCLVSFENAPVNLLYTSRYLFDVPSITSGGNIGAGGSLFHPELKANHEQTAYQNWVAGSQPYIG